VFSKPQTRAQQLASWVEKSIVDRNLAPGDRIATMQELRDESGYAKSTVGETVRILAERGSVEVRPGRGGGLYVAPARPMVRLRRTLLTVPQGSSTAADAIAVREALEELIALEAAVHRTPGDINDLRVRMSHMESSGDDWRDFMSANWALHERIAEITPNDLARGVYLGTIRTVADLSVRADVDADAARVYLDERIEIHARLVDAIIAGNVERTRDAVDAHRGIANEAATAITPGPHRSDLRSRTEAAIAHEGLLRS
jgi:GntR family transcriptional regulator, transcriptional repressor for pyruvate dehydrogenase complex